MKLSTLFLFATLACIPAAAQPVIQGIASAASYTVFGLPNAGIALGSMFVIFGTGLGPSTFTQVSSYPLPTTQGLAGTTVNIVTASFAGNPDAIVIYTSATQVAAIVPSSLNHTGGVTVTVTYNGQTSNLGFMDLIPSTFGAFTVNQSGTGPAVAYNYNSASDQPLNTYATPATPGQVVTLWGTGLGPVSGAETAGPLPGQMNLNLQLYVGGQQVTPSYYGRSGCCVGIDQIVFAVPQGVKGCEVPLAVVINGIVGNTSAIAVSPDGSACSDALGPSSANVQTGATKGTTRFAAITLAHVTGDTPPDGGTATFASTPFSHYSNTLSGIPSAGSCVLASGGPNSTAPPTAETLLDAGPSLQVSGPSGTAQLTKTNGTYAGALNPVQAGTYTVTGSGGSDVGAFTASVTVPGGGSWNATAINPGTALPVTWTASDPNAMVSFTGATANATNGLFSVFVCAAPASAGALTVPGYITAAMAPGTGVLLFLQTSGPVSFSAPGIDQGFLSYSLGSGSSTFTVGPPPIKE
jgi:uncharacterized protein (TIGR03437 family)